MLQRISGKLKYNLRIRKQYPKDRKYIPDPVFINQRITFQDCNVRSLPNHKARNHFSVFISGIQDLRLQEIYSYDHLPEPVVKKYFGIYEKRNRL